MNKQMFHTIGWILLLGVFISWTALGHFHWQFILLLAAYLCFSIGNGKVSKWKWLSVSQIVLIVFSFIIAFVIAFGLIQLANYLINDVFHLHGGFKTFVEWTAAILSLLLAVTLLGSILNRIDETLEKKARGNSNRNLRK